MQKLLDYLNSLSRPERASFCSAIDTSENYLRKAVSIRQGLNPRLSVRIERVTAGKITRKDLHKSDWRSIWPELATKREAK